MINPKSYVICTTPRSGSNLLCDLLAASKVMGNPQEFLNVDSMLSPFCKKNGLVDTESKVNLESYIKLVMEKFSSQNQVFGMKALFDQLEPFLELNSTRQFLQNSKFIWLVRQDVLAQAVSMYIAQATDEWTSLNEENNRQQENKNRRDTLKYNQEKIDKKLKYLTRYNLKWLEFFAINKIEYLTVFYEDIFKNPTLACQDICRFCGVETDYSFPMEKAKFKKQGDQINETFITTFSENSGLNLKNISPTFELDIKGVKLIE
ncbi:MULTISPECIES: Stf0 family sulfotransferase [Planktothrix]|uniref:Stf0 family sulfotransferase n=1 Tax=Planktothrix TaxID=54304 RepID=UPI000403393B|nr:MULTISPECIES: Stf0 family sulfotransferase [Planktothrix]